MQMGKLKWVLAAAVSLALLSSGMPAGAHGAGSAEGALESPVLRSLADALTIPPASDDAVVIPQEGIVTRGPTQARPGVSQPATVLPRTPNQVPDFPNPCIGTWKQIVNCTLVFAGSAAGYAVATANYVVRTYGPLVDSTKKTVLLYVENFKNWGGNVVTCLLFYEYYEPPWPMAYCPAILT